MSKAKSLSANYVVVSEYKRTIYVYIDGKPREYDKKDIATVLCLVGRLCNDLNYQISEASKGVLRSVERSVNSTRRTIDVDIARHTLMSSGAFDN